MRFRRVPEQVAVAPTAMDITPTQRMLSACAGVLATNVVVTPMGTWPECRYESLNPCFELREELKPTQLRCVSTACAGSTRPPL